MLCKSHQKRRISNSCYSNRLRSLTMSAYELKQAGAVSATTARLQSDPPALMSIS